MMHPISAVIVFPSKMERVERAIGYTGASLAGLAACVWTPVSISEQLGAATYVWATLLFLGGLVAAWSTLTGRYLIEWPSTYVLATGTLLYLIALFSITMNEGGLTRLTQTFLISAYMWALLARAEHLRGLASFRSKAPLGGVDARPDNCRMGNDSDCLWWRDYPPGDYLGNQSETRGRPVQGD